MAPETLNKSLLLDELQRWKKKARDEYKTILVGLFGSWARDEARQNSDIDILIECLPGATLFDWVGLAQAMEDSLHSKVDLVPEKNLKERLRSVVEAELIRL